MIAAARYLLLITWCLVEWRPKITDDDSLMRMFASG